MRNAFDIKYRKMYLANRNFLLGAEFYVALRALEFARSYHNGKRKDGSPEFIHQLSMGLYARDMHKLLMFPEETLATVYLHDVCEDYDVSHDLIRNMFGDKIADAVFILDKNRYQPRKMTNAEYFDPMESSAIASVVKGIDRTHNFSTMPGVFSPEKQKAYMQEAIRYILPMLKKAFYNFPEQAFAYGNIRHLMKLEIELISKILGVPAGI